MQGRNVMMGYFFGNFFFPFKNAYTKKLKLFFPFFLRFLLVFIIYLLFFSSISGEILMQGRNVMMGYLNQPEKTDEAITKSGWLRSGDLGTVDDAGFFKITGRAKEILITAGK